MTFCPFAVQKPISNHSWPGTLAAKKLIVLHITQGPTASSAGGLVIILSIQIEQVSIL